MAEIGFNRRKTLGAELALTRTLTAGLVVAMALMQGTRAAEAPPAAFVQADAATKRIPYERIRLTRGGVTIAPDTPMRPCDKVEFVATAAGPERVRIFTLQGGRATVLDNNNLSVDVACGATSLTEAAARVWRDIAGPAVSGVQAAAPRVAVAGSRGAPLELPVFDAPMSTIVAGRRALFLTWRGGTPPYRVVLFRADAQGLVKLVDQQGIGEPWVELPEVDIVRGRHRLELHTAKGSGGNAALAEDNLVALAPSELPRPPNPLSDVSLTPAERELLYAYFLEGLGSGGWTFEAMQRVRGVQSHIPAAREWLRRYGEP